jgi:hypothetical protein
MFRRFGRPPEKWAKQNSHSGDVSWAVWKRIRPFGSWNKRFFGLARSRGREKGLENFWSPKRRFRWCVLGSVETHAPPQWVSGWRGAGGLENFWSLETPIPVVCLGQCGNARAPGARRSEGAPSFGERWSDRASSAANLPGRLQKRNKPISHLFFNHGSTCQRYRLSKWCHTACPPSAAGVVARRLSCFANKLVELSLPPRPFIGRDGAIPR